jgi:eukaryotic-like serine/threonine-protein kinase
MTSPAIDATFIAFQEAVAGRYSLERELGRGGMGIVYLAREVRLDRRVAIKLLPPEMAAQESLRDRFLREARTAARLSHPYIVPLHAVDEVGAFVFYVMAYVEGETLAQRVASRGPLSPHEASRVLREVSWALAYAHAQGVVHRDIKPANILLEHGTNRAMVTDFGIARVVHAGSETAVGELLGTPEYMSPEQAAGEPVDGRSDLYSLGVVAHYVLTGQLPFQANTAQALLAQHITRPAPALATVSRGVPRALAQAVDRCLEKNPAQRFANGEALADALAPSLEKHTEVPVPIRVFLDRRRAIPLIIPFAAGFPLFGTLMGRIMVTGSTLTVIAGMALTVGAAATIPLLIVLARLRKLARLGYGPSDIAAGLRASFERKREEFHYDFGTTPSIRERVLRVMSVGGLASGAAGIAGLIVGAPTEFAGPAIVIGIYSGIIGSIFSSRWRRLRKGTGSGWQKFWEGRVGQTLGRLATFKLGSRAVAAERATEVAIAMSASSLYDALPKETRTMLGDVPETLQGLEAHARALRARIEKLDGAIQEAQHSRAGAAAGTAKDALVGDLRDARAEAEARLADVVTALETLRLDLLRLSAGAGNAEGVTRAVEAARVLSEEADRMIAGQREVDRVLAR